MLIKLFISLLAWSTACTPIMQEKTEVIIKELIKIANVLDERGLTKEADVLDEIVDKAKGFAGEVKGWFGKEELSTNTPDSPLESDEVLNVSKSTSKPKEKPIDISSVSNEQFLDKLSVIPPGKAREDFLYKTVSKNPEVKAQIAKQLKDQLVPVTVKGPHGTTITYNVTPDFLYVDTPSGRRRLQMTGSTAEKIGKEFNMELPTDKMVDDIWEASSVRVRPPPLSASGVEIDGKRYSAQDVVSKSRGGVPIMMDPQALAEYNRKINEQLKDRDNSALVAGHLKTITKQRKGDDPQKLRLSGWKGEKGKALQPSQLTHHGVGHYYDYSHGTRYASNEVTVTLPDGTQEKTTMKELLDHPERYSAMAYKPGYTQYEYE